ncbi:glycosyltransferase family 2 protein [Pseudosporangium ferrugineum]|uniref:Glycosyl transferase family 2 n=1 Tax=Pseudosporangium ferrugineum TaxID=439699 RepID=A0A2T0S846_9ACTN|nr:glycosyltransferase [Pseudosporangium ferrugineum]PRY29599.1 glycosyl transferase family 2 [Pseudosporangium ferrugineum]
MNTVLLSVVVPVYRVEGYLYQCLESIRAGLTAAESASVEVIAVDDASPDGCGAMLDGYADRHGDLRVVHLSRNVGLGLARNAGLAEARGDYVWFVDSDDWLPPGSVRAVLDRLRADRPDVLLVDHLRVHENGRLEPDASSGALKDPGLPSLIRLQHTAWNRIVRCGLLEELDLRFLPGWYEDVPFSNPVLIAARSVSVLDRVCYHYRIGRLGAITATRSERHFEAFDQYDRMLAWVAARDPEPWLRHQLFTLMVNHLLVVAGNDGRLHPGRRRAFFKRLVAHYRRYLPAGYPGHPGIKHRLVRLGSYALYAALRQAYRIGKRDPELSPAVRPVLASAPQPAQAATIR